VAPLNFPWVPRLALCCLLLHVESRAGNRVQYADRVRLRRSFGENVFFGPALCLGLTSMSMTAGRWLTPRADAAEAKRGYACMRFLRWLRHTECWASYVE
jgi:hypothetical protein